MIDTRRSQMSPPTAQARSSGVTTSGQPDRSSPTAVRDLVDVIPPGAGHDQVAVQRQQVGRAQCARGAGVEQGSGCVALLAVRGVVPQFAHDAFQLRHGTRSGVAARGRGSSRRTSGTRTPRYGIADFMYACICGARSGSAAARSAARISAGNGDGTRAAYEIGGRRPVSA